MVSFLATFAWTGHRAVLSSPRWRSPR